jgi:hypothetical protein
MAISPRLAINTRLNKGQLPNCIVRVWTLTTLRSREAPIPLLASRVRLWWCAGDEYPRRSHSCKADPQAAPSTSNVLSPRDGRAPSASRARSGCPTPDNSGALCDLRERQVCSTDCAAEQPVRANLLKVALRTGQLVANSVAPSKGDQRHAVSFDLSGELEAKKCLCRTGLYLRAEKRATAGDNLPSSIHKGFGGSNPPLSANQSGMLEILSVQS